MIFSGRDIFWLSKCIATNFALPETTLIIQAYSQLPLIDKGLMNFQCSFWAEMHQPKNIGSMTELSITAFILEDLIKL